MKHQLLHLASLAPDDDEDFQEEEDLFRPPAKFFAEPSDNIVAESRIEGGRLFVRFYADAVPTDTDERVSDRVSKMLQKNEGPRGDYGAPFTGRIAAGYAAALAEEPPPALPEPAAARAAAPTRTRFLPVVSAAKTFAESTPRQQEKRDMSNEDQLAEWHKKYKALEKEHGREPTLKEFADALGYEGNAATSYAYSKRNALVKAGLVVKRGPGGKREDGESAPRGLAMPARAAKKSAPKKRVSAPPKSRAKAEPVAAAPAAPVDPIVAAIRGEAAVAAARLDKLNRLLEALAD